MIKRLWKWLGFHWHDWSNWEVQGEITIGPEKRSVGFWQTRNCTECKKLQLRQVRG